MIFADLAEAISILKDTLSDEGLAGIDNIKIFSKKANSISRRSKDAICYFPVLTSRSISYEEVTMINKVLERQFTTYLRIAIGLDDVIEEEMSKAEYISRFHVNLDKQLGTAKLFDSAIKGMNESNIPYTVAKDQFVSPKLESYLSNIRTNLNKEIINYSPLQEDALAPLGRMILKEGRNNSELPEAGSNSPERRGNKKPKKGVLPTDSTKETIYKNPYTNQLIDNDVKKANEVIPTTLNVEIRVKGQAQPTYILMGVKTITHPIDSEEMIFNVASAIREKRLFFRTIQWTTGEIKFFKDFVLAMDRIKKNVEQSRNRTNWWRSLRRLSLSGKFKRIINRDDIIPNTSVVLSMDEVEYISNAYGINLLRDVDSVRKLIDHFNLLSFVIVDSSSELAYFLFDGEANFQTFSYNALERENSNKNNDMKALVSLMSR